MTNEEKAKEIAQEHEKYIEHCRVNLHLEGKSKVDVARETAYAAAIEMAEWKDEQLKQFLKDRYNKNLGSIKSWETASIYQELFNEPITEHPMNF